MDLTSSRFAFVPATLVAVTLLLSGCADDDVGLLTVFAEPTEGDAPLEVQFTARAGADDSEFTYKWRLGDGTTSEEPELTHTYSNPGEYEVWVEVTAPSGSIEEAKETVTVTGVTPDPEGEDGSVQPDGDPAGGDYEDWQAVINGACATSTAAAAQVEGDRNSAEALARFVEINNAETEAIAAAGLPTENAAEAQEWIDLRNQASSVFVDMATNPPTAAEDPRIAELDRLALELSALSQARGLEACQGQ